MKRSFLLLPLAALLILAGCSSPQATDVASYKSSANQAMANQASLRTRVVMPEPMKQELRKQWADQGDVIDMIDLSEEIQAPTLVSAVPPVYPRTMRVRAKVTVAAVIDETGNVTVARVYQSTNAGFNASALRAISQWKFTPARTATHAIKMLAIVPIEFEL